VVLVLLSRLKHDVAQMTVNFVDLMVIDRDSAAFLFTIFPQSALVGDRRCRADRSPDVRRCGGSIRSASAACRLACKLACLAVLAGIFTDLSRTDQHDSGRSPTSADWERS